MIKKNTIYLLLLAVLSNNLNVITPASGMDAPMPMDVESSKTGKKRTRDDNNTFLARQNSDDQPHKKFRSDSGVPIPPPSGYSYNSSSQTVFPPSPINIPVQLQSPVVKTNFNPQVQVGTLTWRQLLNHFFNVTEVKSSDEIIHKGTFLALTSLHGDGALHNFIYYMLMGEKYNRINQDENGQLMVTNTYVKSIMIYAENFFSDHPTFQNRVTKEQIQDFIISLVSLRTLIEIRKRHITCENAAVYYKKSKSLNERFETLCNEPGKYSSVKKSEFFQGRGKTSSNSKPCSGFYMNKFRLNVSNEQQNKKKAAPIEFFDSFNLIKEIRSGLVNIFHKKERNDRASEDLTLKTIANRIMRAGAYQFEPGYVKDLLLFLQNNYGITITRILDLCSGWGDRLLGSLASRNPFGIQRYIGTDPNEELQEGYRNICLNYAPQGLPCRVLYVHDYVDVNYKASEYVDPAYKVKIYKKPLEDLTSEELHPDGIKSDLMFTSIPYFDREEYKGANQSHIRYNTYDLWKDKFLSALVKQSVEGLNVGGVIAVNSAEILNTQKTGEKSHNIPKDVDLALEAYGHTPEAIGKGLYLKKLTTFMYDGQKPSPITLYQLCKRERVIPKPTFLPMAYNSRTWGSF